MLSICLFLQLVGSMTPPTSEAVPLLGIVTNYHNPIRIIHLSPDCALLQSSFGGLPILIVFLRAKQKTSNTTKYYHSLNRKLLPIFLLSD